MRSLLSALLCATSLCLVGCYSMPMQGYGGAYTVPQGTYIPQGGNNFQPTPVPSATPWPQGPQGSMQGTNPTATLNPSGPLGANPNGSESAPSRPLQGASPQRQLPDSIRDDQGVPLPKDTPNNSTLTDPHLDEVNKPIGNQGSAQLEAPEHGQQPGNLQQFVDDRHDGIGNRDDDTMPRPPVHQVNGTSSLLDKDDQSPYLFDEERHTFLRGIITYGDREKAWRIQYGNDEADVYEGELTIAPSQWLDGVLDGDVVLLEGKLDFAQRDHRAKPKYVLHKPPQRLKPKRK